MTTATQYEVHPVAAIFPMLPESELRDLAASIKANGLLEPIALKSKLIVDGRNRLAACEIAGVKPSFCQWHGPKGVRVEAWIIAKNRDRRHMTPSQLAMVGAELMKAGLLPSIDGGGHQSGEVTAAATAMSVSTASVERAAVVVERGADELREAVKSGDVAVSAAAEIATLPKREQKALVKEGPKAMREKAREMREEPKPRPAKAEPSERTGVRQKQAKQIADAVQGLSRILHKIGIVNDDGSIADDLVREIVSAGRPVIGAKRVPDFGRSAKALASLAKALA